MSNEFVALFLKRDYGRSIKQAISIMEYFSRTDQQADRLLWILHAIQDDVFKQSADSAADSGSFNPSRYAYHMESGNCSADHLESIFARATVSSNASSTIVVNASEAGGNSLWQDVRGSNGSASRPGHGHAEQGQALLSRDDAMTTLEATNMSRSMTTAAGTPCNADSNGVRVAPSNTQAPGPVQNSYSSPMSRFGAAVAQPPPPLEFLPPMTPASQSPPYGQRHQHSDVSMYGPAGSGPSDPDRTETLETETEEFDLDCLWDWPDCVVSGIADTSGSAVSPISAGESQRVVPTINCAGPTPQSSGRVEADDRPKDQPLPPLQPVYSSYSTHMGYGAAGWNFGGSGGSGMTTPHNRTADFG